MSNPVHFREKTVMYVAKAWSSSSILPVAVDCGVVFFCEWRVNDDSCALVSRKDGRFLLVKWELVV